MTGVLAPASETATARGWLEILDRTGKVDSRFPLGGVPLRIGRAYDNDIVVDDPYICPHHVRITWHEGMLRVVDMDSINGVFFGPEERRAGAELVGNDGLFRLGRTTLRFRRHDCPLPPTLVDRPLHAPLRLIERPWVLGTVYFGVVLYQGSAYYLTSSSEIEPLRMVTEQVALVAMLMAWAAAWSFPSRLLLGRWNFLIHCGIAAVAIMLHAALSLVGEFASYVFDFDAALQVVRQAGLWMVVLVTLYAHMRYLVALPTGRVLRWVGGVTGSLMLLALLFQYLEAHEFRPMPQVDFTLKPPPLQLADGVRRAQLMAELTTLREAVDGRVGEAGPTP